MGVTENHFTIIFVVWIEHIENLSESIINENELFYSFKNKIRNI